MKPVYVKKDGKKYYGGAQAWFAKERLIRSGCGVIATTNLVEALQKKYLCEYEDFMAVAEEIERKYIPVLPILGVNGWTMTLGIKRYLRKKNLPYKARWGCLPKNIWKKSEEMLRAGIPVVMSIGPVFPMVRGLGKNTPMLELYTSKDKAPAAKTNAHYVMIFDMDEEWLTISSWGKRFFVKKVDYMSYAKRYSNFLYSNILCISHK